MKKLAAGNWKMNGLKADGLALARDIVARARQAAPACELLLCPPATLLASVAEATAGSQVALGGQNCNAAEKGAHTGEISAPMLKDAGCSFVILGHSERRADQGETDAQVHAKTVAAHKVGLCSIVCIGETLAQREAGQTSDLIGLQLRGALHDRSPDQIARIVVAYEPVWAIGTGIAASGEDANAVATLIRRILVDHAKANRSQ